MPEDRVEEVMRFILRGDIEPPLVRESRSTSRRRRAQGFDPLKHERYRDLVEEMSDEDVRDAYRRGSELQKQIWEALAQHPMQPVLFSELSDRLGVSRHAVPASIGRYLDAAKERYGGKGTDGKRPHHECRNADKTLWWIWLDERVARIILDEAGS